MVFTFTGLSGVYAYFYNTSDTLIAATNEQLIGTIQDQFVFDAANGQVVYLHVEGISATTKFNIDSQLVITRVTPYKSEEQERIDIERNVTIYSYTKRYVYVEPPLKPRMP